MVRRAADALLQSRVEETVIVLGHQSEEVGEAVRALPLRSVVNADFASGQMSSMRCGLDSHGSRQNLAPPACW